MVVYMLNERTEEVRNHAREQGIPVHQAAE